MDDYDPTPIVISIAFVVFVIALPSYLYAVFKRQHKINLATPVCPTCIIILDRGARFCHKCGNEKLTNLVQFNKEHPSGVLFTRLAIARDTYKAKEQLYEVRELYDKLVQCVYCEKCGGEYSPDSPYCSNCGQPTVPLSRELIFKWLRSKMPQVVATEEDFKRIERMASPVLGKKGRAAFTLTKFVAKKAGIATLNLSKAVAKSAIQRIHAKRDQ